MSDIRNYPFMVRRTERPAVLPGGTPLVRIPDGFTVTRDKSRWGVNMALSPRAPRDSELFPGWPIYHEGAIEEARALLGRVNRTGEPMGYLGPYEQRLEQRLAREIARFAPDDAPPVHVFACRSGSAAEWAMYMGVLYKRLVVEQRKLAGTPEIITPAVTFEATWSKALMALARCRFAEVNEHGCLDVAAAEAAINEATQMICGVLLYNHGPDLDALLDVGRRHDLDIVLDSAHGPLVRYNKIHVAYLVSALIISGQESKIITNGSEIGFIVTTDPILASYFTRLRNVGRAAGTLPTWWSRLAAEAFGDNARTSELDSILTEGSLQLYLDWEPNRTEASAGIHQGIAAHPELPWTTPPTQAEYEGLFYKLLTEFDASTSSKPEAWARVGWEHSMHWLAAELVTEVARYYPTPDEPEAEYHPNIPWAPSPLIPIINPSTYPTARSIVARAHLLPHELLARHGAAQQVIAAMVKMHHHVDTPEIQALDWTLPA